MKPDTEERRRLRWRLSEIPLLMEHAVDEMAQAGAHLAQGQLNLWVEGLPPEDVRTAIVGDREYAREVIGGGGALCPWQVPEEKAIARGATYRSPDFDSRLAFIGRFRDMGAYCWGEEAFSPMGILLNYQTRSPGSNQVLSDRMQSLQRLVTDPEHQRLTRDVFGLSLQDPLTYERFAASAQRLCSPAPITARRAGCQLVIEQPLEGPFHSAAMIGPIAEGLDGLHALGMAGGAIQELPESIHLEAVITEGKPKGIGISTQQTASNQCQRINMGHLIFGINMYIANHTHEQFVSCMAAYVKAVSLYARALHQVFTAGAPKP